MRPLLKDCSVLSQPSASVRLCKISKRSVHDPESVGSGSLIAGKPYSKAKCISRQNIEVKTPIPMNRDRSDSKIEK